VVKKSEDHEIYPPAFSRGNVLPNTWVGGFESLGHLYGTILKQGG